MKYRMVVVLATFAALVLATPLLAQNATPAPNSVEVCAACHEEQATAFARQVHGKARPAEGALTCESCHGSGAEHIDGGDTSKIVNPAKVDAAKSSAVCLTCHKEPGAHAKWRGSRHEGAGLSCTSCHSVHNPGAKGTLPAGTPSTGASKLLKGETQADTCFSCHANIRQAQFQRSTHLFRNDQGGNRLECSSCHEPHGTADRMMRTANVNDTCFSCHAEKRGPFLWEHAPVRENCMNCHSAHGSNNTQLLKMRAPMLCQSCHMQGRHQTVAGSPEAAWMNNRSCANCHQLIHGSNHPSGINLQR